MDSLVIDASSSPFGLGPPQYSKILKFGHHVYIINAETGKLVVLDLINRRFKPLHLGGDSSSSRRIVNFTLGPSSVFAVDTDMDFIYEYDLEGQYLCRIRLNSQFSHRHTTGRKNLVYNPIRNSFLVNVDKTSTERIMLKRPKRAKKYFQRNDLIVEINRKGKKLNYFGAFDSLYQQQFYFYGIDYEFVVSQDGTLILNQELSDAIQIYESPDKRAKELNFRGKYLRTTQQQLPVTHSPYTNSEDYYSHRIASYQYRYIDLLNNGGLFFRTYADVASDSTLDKVYSAREEPANSKMCLAPSMRKLEQQDLLMQKPWYVQIINVGNSELLYDGPFPFQGGYFLPSKDENPTEFYSYTWSEGIFKLYRYDISKIDEILKKRE